MCLVAISPILRLPPLPVNAAAEPGAPNALPPVVAKAGRTAQKRHQSPAIRDISDLIFGKQRAAPCGHGSISPGQGRAWRDYCNRFESREFSGGLVRLDQMVREIESALRQESLT